MRSETNLPMPSDSTATLNGMLALLASAGLSNKQIEAVTGRDPRHVRLLIEDAAESPARERSVLDRARITLAARSER